MPQKLGGSTTSTSLAAGGHCQDTFPGPAVITAPIAPLPTWQ